MMSRFSGQLTEISFFSNIFIDLEKEKEREKEKEGWTIKKKKILRDGINSIWMIGQRAESNDKEIKRRVRFDTLASGSLGRSPAG